jgi:hypothetical protein
VLEKNESTTPFHRAIQLHASGVSTIYGHELVSTLEGSFFCVQRRSIRSSEQRHLRMTM